MHWGTKAFVSATPFERCDHSNERCLIRQMTQSLMGIPQRKKGFSALCILDIGGDEIRIHIILKTLASNFITL